MPVRSFNTPRTGSDQSLGTRSGFTLVEIMIVVLIIGILATLGQMAVKRINLRARAATYLNDCRVFAQAYTQYAHEKGDFPADVASGVFPAAMAGAVNRSQWTRVTPLGGVYNWDNKDATNSTGSRFNAAIRIDNCNWSMADLQRIDSWYDDGNLSTGNIIVTDAGATVLYVVEGMTAQQQAIAQSSAPSTGSTAATAATPATPPAAPETTVAATPVAPSTAPTVTSTSTTTTTPVTTTSVTSTSTTAPVTTTSTTTSTPASTPPPLTAEQERELAKEQAERARELAKQQAEAARELAKQQAEAARELAKQQAEKAKDKPKG